MIQNNVNASKLHLSLKITIPLLVPHGHFLLVAVLTGNQLIRIFFITGSFMVLHITFVMPLLATDAALEDWKDECHKIKYECIIRMHECHKYGRLSQKTARMLF